MDAGQILYENTGENLGGAGGFNFGIRRAYEAGYDAIWIMDDDTYPHRMHWRSSCRQTKT